LTLRKIARLGHPVLLARAAAIDDPADPALQALIDDMLETLADAGGVGLAAPQVHEARRVLVAVADPEAEAPGTTAPPLVLVNPELVPEGRADVLGIEGCLSIPGLRGIVPRHARVGYRALDRHGRPIAGEARGRLARVLQHEVDHLDGILYTMRLEDMRDLAFDSELRHLLARWDEKAAAGPSGGGSSG